MSKKLLLTTVLSSTLMMAGSAQAADLPLTYNGSNTYTFGGTNYNSLTDLAAFIDGKTNNVANVNFEADDVVITEATVSTFITELIAANSPIATQLAPIIAKQTGIAQATVLDGLTKAATEARALIASGELTIEEINEELGLSKGFSEDFTITQQGVQGLVQAADVKKKNTAVDEAYEEREDELAANNPTLTTDVAARDALKNKANKTDAEKTELRALENKIANSAGFEDLRITKENQAYIKAVLEEIARLQASSSDILKAKAAKLLTEVEEEVNRYLITEVTSEIVEKGLLPDPQTSDSQTTQGLAFSAADRMKDTDRRMADLAGAGLSTGDPFETYGVWIKGVFTQATQKAYGLETGYKLDQKGVTIGADTGDEAMIGIAYSFSQSDIKNKATAAIKDDVQTHSGTIYGSFAATNEVYVSAQAQFGKSTIKKTRKDVLGESSAKPKGDTVAAKMEVGYTYAAANDVHVIPTVGVSFVDVKVNGYTETGTGQNRSVSKRTTNRTSGTAGVTAKYVADMGSMKVVPEVHANIDYAFNNKNSNTMVQLGNLDPVATPSAKLEKGYYNVGTSVKALQSEMYEISAGYDLGLSKKFQSHTGTVKLKVNL